MIRYLSIIIKIDAAELAEVFHAEIVCRYDISNRIISDRESIFISDFWLAICYHLKIKRRLSIVFYSQTNDQIERQN